MHCLLVRRGGCIPPSDGSNALTLPVQERLHTVHHSHKEGSDPFEVFAVAGDETCQEVVAWRGNLTTNNTGHGVTACTQPLHENSACGSFVKERPKPL